MRSLTITFAKGLNSGKVQLERYHLHVLRTIREARNAAIYVLFNQQKHEKGRYSKIDEYSSLLLMDKALEMIKNFVRKNRMTLTIQRVEPWNLDRERSYLLKEGLRQILISSQPANAGNLS